MTRNSSIWWLGLAAGLAPVVADQFWLLHVDPLWLDRAKFIGAILSTVSAYLRMSPLALSPDSSLAGTADPTKTLAPMPQK